MATRRTGPLFERNKETVSIVRDNPAYRNPMGEMVGRRETLKADGTFPDIDDHSPAAVTPFIVCNIVPPNNRLLRHEDSVAIGSPDIFPDLVVILKVRNDAIKNKHRVVRSDGSEYEILNIFAYDAAMDLYVKE